jgi:hypothetical protein
MTVLARARPGNDGRDAGWRRAPFGILCYLFTKALYESRAIRRALDSPAHLRKIMQRNNKTGVDCRNEFARHRLAYRFAFAASGLFLGTCLAPLDASSAELQPGTFVFGIGAEQTFYHLPKESYVIDSATSRFATTKQDADSGSPKASLAYVFSDQSKFPAFFGANTRLNVSVTRDYAKSVASQNFGRSVGTIILINGALEDANSYTASVWTDTQTYEEWRGEANVQTDYRVSDRATLSPRIGITASTLDMSYNLNRNSPGNNNGIPYTMIDAHGRGVFVGASLGLDAKQELGNGFSLKGGVGIDLEAALVNLGATQDPTSVDPLKHTNVNNSANFFMARPTANVAVAYTVNSVTAALTASFAYTANAPYIALTQAAGQMTRIGQSTMWGAGIGGSVSVAF